MLCMYQWVLCPPKSRHVLTKTKRSFRCVPVRVFVRLYSHLINGVQFFFNAELRPLLSFSCLAIAILLLKDTTRTLISYPPRKLILCMVVLLCEMTTSNCAFLCSLAFQQTSLTQHSLISSCLKQFSTAYSEDYAVRKIGIWIHQVLMLIMILIWISIFKYCSKSFYLRASQKCLEQRRFYSIRYHLQRSRLFSNIWRCCLKMFSSPVCLQSSWCHINLLTLGDMLEYDFEFNYLQTLYCLSSLKTLEST